MVGWLGLDAAWAKSEGQPESLPRAMALPRAGHFRFFPRGDRCAYIYIYIYIASLHPRLSVRGEEPQPTRGDPVFAEHSGYKGVNIEKISSPQM